MFQEEPGKSQDAGRPIWMVNYGELLSTECICSRKARPLISGAG